MKQKSHRWEKLLKIPGSDALQEAPSLVSQFDPGPMNLFPRLNSLRWLVPGILVAATGVGAGDLLTASLAGAEVGTIILWGALFGAVLKWSLNEGIARWQLATGTTLLEGWIIRLGPALAWGFFIYLIMWSYFVGGALINACGVAGVGLLPLGDTQAHDWTPDTSKIVWGMVHSLIGLLLVWFGGFRLFSKFMSACIALLFVCVLITALMLRPDWSTLAPSLLLPRVPEGGGRWLIALLGGVGGTVTLLAYGYWIREDGRAGTRGLRISQWDLAVGYALTAFFGVAMVIIGARTDVEGQGTLLALQLADQLAHILGEPGRWIFLLGFWGAVFSSLLGVWQSVPYLFADFLAIRQGISIEQRAGIDLTRSKAYRCFLLAIATLPLATLFFSVRNIQLAYSLLGALFMPLVAITLLIMNNRVAWVGTRFRNTWPFNVLLVVTLAIFIYVGARDAWSAWSGQMGGGG